MIHCLTTINVCYTILHKLIYWLLRYFTGLTRRDWRAGALDNPWTAIHRAMLLTWGITFLLTSGGGGFHSASNISLFLSLSAAADPQAFCQDRFCSAHEFCGENSNSDGTRCHCRAIFASPYRSQNILGKYCIIPIQWGRKNPPQSSDRYLNRSCNVFCFHQCCM